MVAAEEGVHSSMVDDGAAAQTGAGAEASSRADKVR
jgi:hypothetical protein